MSDYHYGESEVRIACEALARLPASTPVESVEGSHAWWVGYLKATVEMLLSVIEGAGIVPEADAAETGGHLVAMVQRAAERAAEVAG